MNKEERRRYDWQERELEGINRRTDEMMRTRRQLGGEFSKPDYMTQMRVASTVSDLQSLLREWGYEAPGRKSEAA